MTNVCKKWLQPMFLLIVRYMFSSKIDISNIQDLFCNRHQQCLSQREKLNSILYNTLLLSVHIGGICIYFLINKKLIPWALFKVFEQICPTYLWQNVRSEKRMSKCTLAEQQILKRMFFVDECIFFSKTRPVRCFLPRKKTRKNLVSRRVPKSKVTQE